MGAIVARTWNDMERTVKACQRASQNKPSQMSTAHISKRNHLNIEAIN